MSEPFIGQVSIFGCNFAPRGWAFCDGQLLPIASYTALFSILGTTYGGDGRTTFALPDLRGRLPMHPGSGPGLTPRSLGQRFGAETVPLTSQQIPPHSLAAQAVTDVADSDDPEGRRPAVAGGNVYFGAAADTPMFSGQSASAGSGQPHNNMQPFTAVYFCIALVGIFPSRN